MEIPEYLNIDTLCPVFVAIFCVVLAWFGVRLLEKDDQDEGEETTQKVKAALNPDKVGALQGGTLDEEENGHFVLWSRKAAMNIEQQMTEEEKERERRIQQEQLRSIFNLLEADKEKYGVESMEDVNEQMKRYAT